MKPAPRRIESASNPAVKAWRNLHKRRERDRERLFLIEGSREVSRALAGGVTFSAVLTSDRAGSDDLVLADAAAEVGALHYVLGPAALARVSFRQNPASIIAVGDTPDFALNRIRLPESPLLVIADGIEKPGNLGAIVRSADGAGADAVIVSDPAPDLVNPNIIRASQGVVFSSQLAASPATDIADWLHLHAIRPLAAAADATGDLWAQDLTGPVAFIVGSEHEGVSAIWRKGHRVSIPMAGVSDSLNVSVAAALLVYEAKRQRTRRHRSPKAEPPPT